MAAKKKLLYPKYLLDMKFMRKTKERIERELQNTHNHEGLYSSLITDEMRNANDNYISTSSIIFCVELMEGRVSFRGMNPEIERLMEDERKKKETNGGTKKDEPGEIIFKSRNKIQRRKRPSSPIKYDIPKKKK